MERLNNILDEKEKVIKTYKPNKFKFFFTSFFINILIVMFTLGIMTTIYFVPFEDDENMPLFVLLIFVGLGSLSLIITYIFTKLKYKKTVYAITDQRIIVQSGIIGIDYKSLDLKVIGASEVRVDILDKITGKNTGTLKFGSQAVQQNIQGIQMFVFSSIEEPYKVYKEIKKLIDDSKS